MERPAEILETHDYREVGGRAKQEARAEEQFPVKNHKGCRITTMTNLLASFITLIVLMSVYLFAGRLELRHGRYYRHWVSFSAGVSIAYVIMHLLPEFAIFQAKLPQYDVPVWLDAILDFRVYIMSLIGLLVYAGLERLIHYSHVDDSEAGSQNHLSRKMIRFHVTGYFLYNVLIGYMVVYTAESGVWAAMLFMIAMGLHFFVMTHGLHVTYREHYQRHLQWILAFGVVLGWLAGVGLELPKNIKIILFSFLAGGIIVNTIREEMPSGRDNRFWPFLVGAISYSILLIIAYYSRHH